MKKDTTPHVDAIGRMHWSGNIMHSEWFNSLKLPSGSTDIIAITLLAEIVYWYRPTLIRDEKSGNLTEHKRKFKADLLQKSYQDMADLFGLTKRQVSNGIERLEKRYGVIRRVFRTIKAEGLVCSNILFLEPVIDRLIEVSQPKTQGEEVPEVTLTKDPPMTFKSDRGHSLESDGSPLKVIAPTFKGHTYTENTTETTTEITTEKRTEDTTAVYVSSSDSAQDGDSDEGRLVEGKGGTDFDMEAPLPTLSTGLNGQGTQKPEGQSIHPPQVEKAAKSSQEAPLILSTDSITVELLVLIYNKAKPDECPKVTMLSPGRMKKYTSYLKQFPTLGFWDHVFDELHMSLFLRGKEVTPGRTPFRASLDWLCEAKDGVENCLKVHEGKYRHAALNQPTSSGEWYPDDQNHPLAKDPE